MDALSFFKANGGFADGKYTDEGLTALAELLELLPTIWGGGKWGPVFQPLMSKVVPFSIEMVVVKDGKVLLTWREFEGNAGWHTPGSYVNPREDWQDTLSRLAKREVGCDVVFERTLHTFNNNHNPRFHDLTVLAQCRLAGDPTKSEWSPGAGEPQPGQVAWFAHKPEKMLGVHVKYWRPIEEALR